MRAKRSSDTAAGVEAAPGPARKAFGRYARLLPACLGVAAAVVLVVAWLNPPADAPPPDGDAAPDGQAPPEVAALPSEPEPATVEQLRKEGEQVVEELLARCPRLPEAMHIAALLYADLHQTEKAEKLWLECVELAPQHAGPQVGLAKIAVERGDDESAVRRLRQALAKGCSTPDLYRVLAGALQKLTRVAEAAEVLEGGLVRFPDASEAWVELGQVQIQLQRFAEAEASLRKAVALDPESAEAYFALGTACARLEKDGEAAAARKRFADLRAKYPTRVGRRFQEVYDHILRRLVADALSRAAVVYRQQQDLSEAERLLRRALAISPASAETCRTLAALYLAEGRVADNRAVQRRLTEIEPNNAANYLNLANLSLQLGDLESSEAALRRAIKVRPDSSIAYCSLAALCLQTGRAQEARSLAQQALERERAAQVYAVLAAACRQLGDREGEEAAAAEARKLTADSR